MNLSPRWWHYYSLGSWPGFGGIPELFDYRFQPEWEDAMSIGAINARNQFKGTVKEIIRGPVLSEVDVETAAGTVTSVITSRSIDTLNIKVGDEVLTVFKSTEVLLAKV
ncbi:MAG TPA: molybdopterin-binding protein [Hyphomicrobiales bacterium]|nr:molybdopterin-binding protein [Hyphomicrobiales bacterium]